MWISSLENTLTRFNKTVSGFSQCSTSIVENKEATSGAYTNMETLHVTLPLLTKDGHIDTQAIVGCDMHELGHIIFSPRVNLSKALHIKWGEIYQFAEESRMETHFTTAFPGNDEIMGNGCSKALGMEDDIFSTMDDEDVAPNALLFLGRPWISHHDSLVKRVKEVKGEEWHNNLIKSLWNFNKVHRDSPVSEWDEALKDIAKLFSSNDKRNMENHKHHNEFCPGSHENNTNSNYTAQMDDIAKAVAEALNNSDGNPMDADFDGAINITISKSDMDSMSTMANKEFAEEKKAFGAGGNDQFNCWKRGIGAVTGKEKVWAKALQSELDKAMLEVDSGMSYGTNNGKVMIGQWMKPVRDFNSMFCKWEPGNSDSLDMEMVILLDLSGSMCGDEKEMFSKTHALAMALTNSSMNTAITVIGYSNDASVLFTYGGQEVKDHFPVFEAEGGTRISPALNIAKNILDSSTKPLKSMLLMTDGRFWDVNNRQLKNIISMDFSDVVTGFFNFNNSMDSDMKEIFDYHVDSRSMNDMSELGKKMVTVMMRDVMLMM